jgi:hypothetical protein
MLSSFVGLCFVDSSFNSSEISFKESLIKVSFYKVLLFLEIYVVISVFYFPVLILKAIYNLTFIQNSCKILKESALKLHEFMKKERKLPKIRIEVE